MLGIRLCRGSWGDGVGVGGLLWALVGRFGAVGWAAGEWWVGEVDFLV